MIRLTVTLIVAIYIVLIIIPEPDHGVGVADGREVGQNWIVALITDAEESASTPRQAAPTERVVRGNPLERLTETEGGFVLETADGEMLEIAAVIDPSTLYASGDVRGQQVANVNVAEAPTASEAIPGVVSEAGPEAAPVVEVALVADPSLAVPVEAATPLWRVAGDRVNFRAAPTTDSAVLTALVQGEEVEYLGQAPDDWAFVRVVATGLEGYMAAQFLEPVN